MISSVQTSAKVNARPSATWVEKLTHPLNVVAAGLILSQIYYCYRYPLKYSDPGTSPTYAATPQTLQVGKYVLFAVLTCFCFTVLVFRCAPVRVAGRSFSRAVAFLVYLMLSLTVLAVASAPTTVSNLAKAWFFLPLVILIPRAWAASHLADSEKLAKFGRVVMLLLAYNVIFEAVELVLYYKSGRLPALAYPGGVLVRFGAGLDDPNGFGTWLLLPASLLVAGWPTEIGRMARLALLAVVGFLLVKTLSYSAFVGAVVAVATVVALSRDTKRGLALVVGAAACSFWLLHSSTFSRIFQLKDKSASSRFEFNGTLGAGAQSFDSYLHHLSASGWLLGSPAAKVTAETSYLALLISFGLVVTIGVALIVLATLWRGLALARARRSEGDRLGLVWVTAITGAFCGMSVSSLGVPLLTGVFPTSLWYWSLASLIWIMPLRPRSYVLPRVGSNISRAG